MAAPTINISMAAKFHFLISLPTSNILATTSPKKKDHNGMGWFSNNQLISLARDRTLMPIPNIRARRKLPLSLVQKALIPSVLKVFKRDRFTLLMLLREYQLKLSSRLLRGVLLQNPPQLL